MTFSSEVILPKTETLQRTITEAKLSIGIPKETHLQERALCLTPDAVSVLVANGHTIVIETGAGDNANYTDNQYSEVGAKISYDRSEVFGQSFILKVQPPDLEEIELIKPNSQLLSLVQPNIQNKLYFDSLAKKKITALGFHYIRDEQNNLPITRILSEIAGTASVLIASELMCSDKYANGLLMGGVTGVRPTEIVIIGAGTVGEYATRAANGMGANVRVFDNSLTRMRRMQNNLGTRISTSFIDPKELYKALLRADVLIAAIRGETRSPVIVSESMVERMKKGSVIIDVSINNGGSVETSEITTHEHPTRLKHGVVHYAVPNIPSKFPRTTTKALSNFFLTYLLKIGREGGLEYLLPKDKGLRDGVYMYHGRMTNIQLCKWFDMQYHDINLLLV